MGITTVSRLIAVTVGVGFFPLTPARALAHCDGLDCEVMASETLEPDDDVATGRAYVKAYVEFIHFVELLYDSTVMIPNGHSEEREVPATHH